MSFDNHEQIVFCNDKDTGLKAIIGIHNTVLGPALGGTRMWKYANEWEALNDVLRLSRGMTYKSAISGLNLGGGKAVIIGDSKIDKTPEMITKFGEYVNSLSGKYITAEDVGTTTEDMDRIHEVTTFVTGISESIGGSGNPSPVTAYGVYMGMKAAAKYQFGTDNLSGKKVLVQGIGHVGETLVDYLTKEGALGANCRYQSSKIGRSSCKIWCVDFYRQMIYTVPMLIFMRLVHSVQLSMTIRLTKLKRKVIAGAANNQLANEQCSRSNPEGQRHFLCARFLDQRWWNHQCLWRNRKL